ncbi:MAG TPA: argininosuccinate lyase [Candidatus Scatomorpha merdavium]|nr:argininosuccinate lyase [Oscillospiraceae bacterium]HIS16213.1 argininosuccinate lyase [Candidatus Scatomorpha merdavium]
MEKLWAGRAHGALDKAADDFNSSISVDSRMYRQDIRGSIAHAGVLAKMGIVSDAEGTAIIEGLGGILAEIDSGKLQIDPAAEDIHSFVEGVLTERLGDTGRKLHTARSRNDQVALDTRLYLRDRTADTIELIVKLINALCDQAEKNADAVMPGYTHLQRAQPITFAHQLLAYGMMLARDLGRLGDAVKRMNVSPLGACALAGTTYPIDREMSAAELGFDGICLNSLDAVSDRDFCVELCSALALVMTHLSRLAEELILWTSWEFRFVELSDAYTTGSSIMPQKKNSDMAELVRGKTGRVYGDLITLLTMLKGLPLAYNKDMQEDKEAVFDAFDTVQACLGVFAPMIETMTVKKDNMLAAAKSGFINATDLADWLAKRGVPFRTAYKLTGEIVAWCIEHGKTLEDMTLEEYKSFSKVFDESLYEDISIAACVAKRTSKGGASPANIAAQIEYLKQVTA